MTIGEGEMPCNACGRTDHTNHLDWLNHPELHEKGCQCMGHKKERNMQDRARDRLKLIASKGQAGPLRRDNNVTEYHR